MSTRRSQRNVAPLIAETASNTSVSMSRSRRSASGAQPTPLAKVSRLPSSSPSSQQSLHFMVKLPSSKLRQATRMAPPARSGPSVSLNSRDQFVGGEIIEGKRSRNVKKSYIVDSDSDDDEDEEMEDIGDDDDAEGESVEEEDDDEMADQDAEGEEEDADGDVDMDIPPPPPIIKISRAEKGKKPTMSVKPTGKIDSKTAEAKEATEASDDEELSELESEMEEGVQLGGEEDAEGEEEEEDVEEVDDEEEEDDDLDSDDETPADGSRASTPDLTKLTKRQRARLEEGGSGHLLALPDGSAFQLLLSTYYANPSYRGASQETSDGRGTCHASC